MTLRQLNRPCGPLSEATTAHVQALPLEQLELLAEVLLDFNGPADLAAWFAKHAGWGPSTAGAVGREALTSSNSPR